MVELRARNVFIDTCIFREMGFHFGSSRFETLVSLARDDKVSVKTADIIIREVKAQIAAEVNRARRIVAEAGEKAPFLLRSTESPLKGLYAQVDYVDIKRQVEEQFRGFLEASQAETIRAVELDAQVIFDKYFAGAEPFGDCSGSSGRGSIENKSRAKERKPLLLFPALYSGSRSNLICSRAAPTIQLMIFLMNSMT